MNAFLFLALILFVGGSALFIVLAVLYKYLVDEVSSRYLDSSAAMDFSSLAEPAQGGRLRIV